MISELTSYAAAAGLLARDGAKAAAAGYVKPRAGIADGALERAIAWLCRTHDVADRGGSSKGYSLIHGWFPPYPETTGYVIGTLLEFAERPGVDTPDLVRRAREMADWEAGIQEPDGGIMEGSVDTRPRRSIVFNTGMVLHGWVDLLERAEDAYAEPARRASAFLVDRMGADGTWDPAVEYQGRAHTYNSRVAWAMLRHAAVTGDEAVADAARRQLDWVLAQQRANGWFDCCIFKAGTTPSTHAIAYTMRGLLESHALSPDDRYVESVVLASEPLIRKLEVLGRLPANYADDWTPTASHECLTGTVQLGGVWLRLWETTGDDRFLNAGLKAVELAAARQERVRWPAVDGALAGSFPLWGRYAPLQYPNWATKFLADSLMLRERCLAAAR